MTFEELLSQTVDSEKAIQSLKMEPNTPTSTLSEFFILLIQYTKWSFFEADNGTGLGTLLIRCTKTGKTGEASTFYEQAHFALISVVDLNLTLSTQNKELAEAWGKVVEISAGSFIEAIFFAAQHMDGLAYLGAQERAVTINAKAKEFNLTPNALINLASSQIVMNLRRH